MRPPHCSNAHHAQAAMLFSLVAVIFVQSCAASPAESNVTSTVLKDILEDEAEELLENMNLTMFKERYRRLIPYMAFYVANNNVHQTTLAKNYANDLSGFLLQKLPPQNPSSRLNGIPKRGNTNYHVNSPNQDKKFIPSIQYDPRNIGGDNDYFTPVKYSNNINYPEYSTPSYQLFQVTKAYPEITTHSSPVLQKNNRYFTTRPLRLPVQSHFIKKPVLDDPQTDYNQNYATRTNTIVNYPNKNYAGPEYIPSLVHQHMQKPLKLYESVRRPSSQLYRKPNVNLNNIIESFQLTEQLPETLNSENIDNSIKTLLEIFKILHSPRKEEEFIQSQGPSVPSVPLLQPKLINYNNYKPKMYTRPKVITEMTFQATLSPLIIPDDSERYKATPYTNDVPIKIPSKPVHSMNKIKQEKIEYYIPYVQDIPSEPKQIHKPLTKPADTSEKHSYQISEDLSDDILNNEQYTLPISTETPVSEEEYQEPNDVALPLPRIPQTSLKYGATRGKPNVDYPAYADIPKTDFNCKEQRYKGFFGDPATGCQVWHYCDLNGGKSSFLCPNGTIFSQVALTCDWWFNVKCETTTQLYVLNERLYKYILPIMPKFPEDFTGPEVDRYLELKFKEMEAKLKEKKLKKQQEEKNKHKGKAQAVQSEEDSQLE